MAKFCTKCGSATDPETGLCPVCSKDAETEIKDTENENPVTVQGNEEVSAPESVPVIESAPAPESAPAFKPEPAFEPVSTPAFTPAFTPASAPVPEKKAKPKKKRSPIFTVLVVILSIFLTLTTLLSVVLFNVSNIISANTIETAISEIDVKEILDTAVDYSDEDVDKFLNTLEENYDIKASLDDLDEFFKKSSVKDFASEKITTFVASFVEGDATLEISKKEIVDLIMDNQKYIEDKYDKKLTKEEAQEIADKFFKGSSIEILSKDNIGKFVDSTVVSTVRFVVSPVLYIVFMIISLVIIALMIICHPSRAACCIGGIYISIGALFTISALLAETIVSAVVNIPVVGTIVGGAMSTLLISGIVVLAIGVVALVARGVTLLILRKMRSAK